MLHLQRFLFTLQGFQQARRSRLPLQIAQARGVRRGKVHRDVIRHRIGRTQAGQVIVRRALVRRVLVLADVEADHAVEVLAAPHVFHPGLDPGIVEAHPVDDRLVRDQPEQSRLRISRLRSRSDRPDLHKAKAQPAQRIDRVPLLVQPGGQAHPVRKLQPHHLHRRREGIRRKDQPQRPAPLRQTQQAQAQVMGHLGIESEQNRADE